MRFILTFQNFQFFLSPKASSIYSRWTVCNLNKTMMHSLYCLFVGILNLNHLHIVDNLHICGYFCSKECYIYIFTNNLKLNFEIKTRRRRRQGEKNHKENFKKGKVSIDTNFSSRTTSHIDLNRDEFGIFFLSRCIKQISIACRRLFASFCFDLKIKRMSKDRIKRINT